VVEIKYLLKKIPSDPLARHHQQHWLVGENAPTDCQRWSQ